MIAKTNEEAHGLKNKNSRIFFSGIQGYGDFNTYRDRFNSMNQEELLTELIEQIYINASIATRKYRKYNLGFKQIIVGFVWFVIIFLIGIYLY